MQRHRPCQAKPLQQGSGSTNGRHTESPPTALAGGCLRGGTCRQQHRSQHVPPHTPQRSRTNGSCPKQVHQERQPGSKARNQQLERLSAGNVTRKTGVVHNPCANETWHRDHARPDAIQLVDWGHNSPTHQRERQQQTRRVHIETPRIVRSSFENGGRHASQTEANTSLRHNHGPSW